MKKTKVTKVMLKRIDSMLSKKKGTKRIFTHKDIAKKLGLSAGYVGNLARQMAAGTLTY